MRYHAELVDKEANAWNVATIQEWRSTHLEEVRKMEKQRSEDLFARVIVWLELKDYVREDEDHLDSLAERCHPQSSNWLFEHSKVQHWLGNRGQHTSLWLNGKPGSGESF